MSLPHLGEFTSMYLLINQHKTLHATKDISAMFLVGREYDLHRAWLIVRENTQESTDVERRCGTFGKFFLLQHRKSAGRRNSARHSHIKSHFTSQQFLFIFAHRGETPHASPLLFNLIICHRINRGRRANPVTGIPAAHFVRDASALFASLRLSYCT